MNTNLSNNHPLDDIDVRVEETEAGAEGRIEFATFTDGEYVRSILVHRTRATKIYQDLAKILGKVPPNVAEALSDAKPDEDAAAAQASSADQEVPVCPHCDSDNVAADAAARWSTTTQVWEVSNIFENGHGCDNCGAVDFSFKWVTPDKVRSHIKWLG